MGVRSVVLGFAIAATLGACGNVMVRQSDLDAWVGVPVEALDSHSFFLTIPMIRTQTESGIEVRNYANGADFQSCSGSAFGNQSGGWVNANAFSNCTTQRIVCNNLFYIKDGKVLEYVPEGRCMTDARVRPQERWMRLRATQ